MNTSPEHEPVFSRLRTEVGLTDAERARGKAAIRARIRGGGHAAPPLASAPWMVPRSLRRGIAAFGSGLLVGGSTLVASASALPGDILYPVRLGVTDEIEYLIAWSPEARADISASQLSDRMAELVLISDHPTDRALTDFTLLSEATAEAAHETAQSIGALAERQREVIAASIADEAAAAAESYARYLDTTAGTVSPTDSAAVITDIADEMDALKDEIVAHGLAGKAAGAAAEEAVLIIQHATQDIEHAREELATADAAADESATNALAHAEALLEAAQESVTEGFDPHFLVQIEDARDAIESVEAALHLTSLSDDEYRVTEALTASTSDPHIDTMDASAPPEPTPSP